MGGLVYIGRQYKVQVLISTGAGGSEPTLAEALRLAGGLDPEWSGLALDSDLFAEGIALGEEQERMALSLAKAVTVSDFAGAAREPRPLGHGSVDFGRLFGTLAKAGFYGPVTVERRYKTGDEPGALSRDAEFARKQIQTRLRRDQDVNLRARRARRAIGLDSIASRTLTGVLPTGLHADSNRCSSDRCRRDDRRRCPWCRRRRCASIPGRRSCRRNDHYCLILPLADGARIFTAEIRGSAGLRGPRFGTVIP